jgi:hypothetical protein
MRRQFTGALVATAALLPATAHVDGDHQRGIFYRLHELRPGDGIDIARADGGTALFEVSTVDRAAKAAFPPKRCTATASSSTPCSAEENAG